MRMRQVETYQISLLPGNTAASGIILFWEAANIRQELVVHTTNICIDHLHQQLEPAHLCSTGLLPCGQVVETWQQAAGQDLATGAGRQDLQSTLQCAMLMY